MLAREHTAVPIEWKIATGIKEPLHRWPAARSNYAEITHCENLHIVNYRTSVFFIIYFYLTENYWEDMENQNMLQGRVKPV